LSYNSLYVPPSAKLADKIIVIHEGKVTESGTHDSLMEKGGTYKELYDKQLQSEEVADQNLN
jgi:ATP-binding cassette subfamily B protein